MSDREIASHSHVFLGAGHERSERKTWAVIALCGAMMVVEIGGGTLFGSLALVADGLHMSTHAAALLIAAAAYTYARHHAHDTRFVFGTGKLGDLAGFASAVVLAMIALLIGYEAVSRLFAPVAIHFSEAIPIACLGLLVNIASALLLSGGEHHEHGHGGHQDAAREAHQHGDHEHGQAGGSTEDPHSHEASTSEAATHRDYNMRAAFVHVIGDAAVSVLAICGLLAAKAVGWLWIDPVMGLIGACVIANWSHSLVRDTGRILLDMAPDPRLAEDVRRMIEADGDRLADLHLWRLGPGHIGAIVSVVTARRRSAEFYRAHLERFRDLSHVTVEVRGAGSQP